MAQGELPSFYRYAGPSPTGGNYYVDPKTGDIYDLPAAPTPEQRQAFEAENPKSGTIGQTQATPSDDGETQTLGGGPTSDGRASTPNTDIAKAASNSGVGAGTTGNPYNSVNNDDNPRRTSASSQTSIGASTAALNKLIPTQPNQLDQYASYTYAISWYLLTPQQYNAISETRRPNVAGWQLLMQSGGAPIAGRSPAFPVDYYMDDLEIESLIPLGGSNMANSATNIRFKVVEPNGITLIQNLFKAVVSVYKNSQQSQTNTNNNGAPTSSTPSTNQTPNYLQAQYCLVVQFYGYDKDGNLVAPAKGAFNTDASTGGYGQQSVIVKYYPFRLVDIKFQIANRAIEYNITGKPIPQSYAGTTDRGTIPFPFVMTGGTVEQLLTGSPVGTTYGTNTADPGARQDRPAPPSNPGASVNDIAASAGLDANGNFTGDPVAGSLSSVIGA